MLQQESSPIFSETLALPSSDLPPLPFLFLHSWCYFKLRRPAKICTLLITCQLLCAMFNALPRLHQVCSESRRLTAAWVFGRLGGGPTVMHRGLLSSLLALNSGPCQAQILPAGHLKMAQHLPHLYTAL